VEVFMSDPIRTTQEKRLLHIVLDRPDKRNALNVELCQQLVQALDHADADPRVGAILLTGEGPAFCAGMDLREALEAPPTEINRTQEQLFSVGARMGTPIVAAVHGPAIAGGMGLVANCHVVVASAKATFGLTEVRLGLWPFLIYQSVVQAVGERRTIELALTGRLFGAAEAREYGLVHEVTSGEAVQERAAEIASRLSEASPTAVRSGLMFVQESRGKHGRMVNDLARDLRNQIWNGDDFREGLKAFWERREPRWPSIRQ
jgi:enoyl-CoA hydratase/carnithine racemase